MSGAMPPHAQYAFMAWCSVKKKHRDNFTFYHVEISAGTGAVVLEGPCDFMCLCFLGDLMMLSAKDILY
jgi:hypothetical protein